MRAPALLLVIIYSISVLSFRCANRAAVSSIPSTAHSHKSHYMANNMGRAGIWIVSVTFAVLLMSPSVTGDTSSSSYYSASSFYSAESSVAHGKPTAQSSTSSGGVSSRGVDGGLSGAYRDGTCTHTSGRNDENAWWSVDLGAVMDVSKVVLFNRLDCCSERLSGAEVYVGTLDPAQSENDVRVSNTRCGEAASGPDVEEQPQIVFECSSQSRGRYVTVRLPEPGVPLSLCEVAVFSDPTEPETILEPHLQADGSCPDPLASACADYAAAGLPYAEAAVKAFMEGPIDCGDMGFFCLMSQDPAGAHGGMTGTPGDKFINNRNFGFCVDRESDRQIDWNNLSRQPKNNDGHCHGSDFDSSYEGVLTDHYYRPYRGIITCCCGLQKEDDDGQWLPAMDYISRCDYRGENENDASKNFENGCGRDIYSFIPKDGFPGNADKCWTLDNFGKPPQGVYEKPSYSSTSITVASCDSGDDFTSCVVDLEDQEQVGDSLLLISLDKSDAPYMVDDIKSCDEVHGVQVSEVGLQLIDIDRLENVLTNQAGEIVTRPNVSFVGCFKDNGSRAFQTRYSSSTMEECAIAAAKAGSMLFGMQYPQGNSNDEAECYFNEKPGALGSDPYLQVEDGECIGENDWQPSAFGQTFVWNGAGWRNAVYELAAPGNGSDELTTKFRKLAGLEAGKTYYLQVMDLHTCALSELTALSIPLN